MSAATEERARRIDGVVILALTRGTFRGPVLQVFASVAGESFEFTRLRPADPFEVYDHPPSYDGIPRFCGYLDAVATEWLDAIIARHEARK